MNYSITHKTSYQYSETVAVCHNRLHLAPRETDRQRCHDYRLVINPAPKLITRQTDYFGNLVDYFSIHGAYRAFEVTATSHVEVAPPPNVDKMPSESWEVIRAQARQTERFHNLRHFPLLIPSARVQISEPIRSYAQQSFPTNRPMLEAIRELNQRIHDDFTFDQEATTIHTTVDEAFRLRRGVCQDFAHLAIACLRSLDLPARYVSGYVRTTPPPGQSRLVGADASHAWCSVYCGDCGWIDLDPTNNLLSGDSHICVAWGRDYDDVSPIQGIFVGGGHHELHVGVDMTPCDEEAKSAAIH